MNDATITNWIYTTPSHDLQNMVMQPKETARDVWRAVKGLFRDNCATHAVYIEAELWSLHQGDMSISPYGGCLKNLADNLRDVGQPVHEENQVLNMLRGLNQKFSHAISTITSKDPLPSFLQACSTLLLEELRQANEEKQQAAHALYANRNSRGGGSAAVPPGSDGGYSSGGGCSRA